MKPFSSSILDPAEVDVASSINPFPQRPLDVSMSALTTVIVPPEMFSPSPEWTFLELPSLPVPAPAAPALHPQSSAAPLAQSSLAAGEPSVAPPANLSTDTITQAQVDAFEVGFELTFSAIQTNLVTQVFAETLPLLGDNLAAAANGGAAPLSFITGLKNAIATGLGTLNGSGTYTELQVETALNNSIIAAGISRAVDLDFANPANVTATLQTSRGFAAFDIPVEANLGLPNLGIATTGTASTAVSQGFNFTTGLDAGGFYLNTGAGQADFNVNTMTTLPGAAVTTDLGLLRFSATDNGTSFPANFAVMLKDPGTGFADQKIRLSELGGDLLDATVLGTANLKLKLASDLGLGAAFPKIGTNLDVVWGFSNAPVFPGDTNVNFGNLPTVTFGATTLELGSFFGDFAGDVLQTVLDVTAPIRPILDILTAPIGLLVDLGSPKVTLLDFLDVPEAQRAVINGLSDIISVAEIANGFTAGGAVPIQLGSLRIEQDVRLAGLDQLTTTLFGSVPSLTGQNASLDSFLEALADFSGGGLSFPILQNPLSQTIGRILLGSGNPEFFTYHPEDLSYTGTIADLFFPVLGPIGITLGGSIELTAAFEFGYDTRGLRDFAAGGYSDAGDLANGFFIQAFNGVTPVTRIDVFGEINAGVAVELVLARAGVEGNLRASLIGSFNPAVPDLEGKVRGDLIANTPVEDLFALSGSLTAGLRAYLEIGISPFSVEFDFESPRVVLLSFPKENGGNEPMLYGYDGQTLTINTGPRSVLRGVGDLTDGAEAVDVDQSGSMLLVSGFGVNQPGFNVTTIVADGGAFADTFQLSNAVAVPSILAGGPGQDVLRGGGAVDELIGGDENDLLNGQNANDLLYGNNGNDLLIGGPGADQLFGGDDFILVGGNVVQTSIDTASYRTSGTAMVIDLRTMFFSGDGIGDVFNSIERFEGSNFADTINGSNTHDAGLLGAQGADTINGHGGNDLLEGNDGDDVLDGGPGDDFLMGGLGADFLVGGDGADTLAYFSSKAPVTVKLFDGTAFGGEAEGDSFQSVEHLFGAPAPVDAEGKPLPGGDRLEGSFFGNIIAGLSGSDLIYGHAGDDVLYGDIDGSPRALHPGFDRDTIYGGDGNDRIYGQADSDILEGGMGHDLIEGGDGDDFIAVGAMRGPVQDPLRLDKINGGAGYDTISVDFSNQMLPVAISVGVLNSVVFPDGAYAVGFEAIFDFFSGAGNDQFFLSGPADNGSGNLLFTGSGDDVVVSGLGNDIVDLGDGDDLVEGGPGADNLNGGNGRDGLSYFGSPASVFVDLQLIGTTGLANSDSFGDTIANFENLVGSAFADELRGTAGANQIQGGGGNDFVDGREGANLLLGGEGDDELVSGAGDDLLLGDAGDDILRAGDGSNVAEGGAGHDMLFGGTGRDIFRGNDGNDRLEGGAGDNLLSGEDGNDILVALGGDDGLDGGTGNDRLEAGAGINFLSGGTGNDVLISLGGDDTLNGGNDDDQLNAGDGTNVLNGDAGNDTLISGSGADTLNGGTGNDRLEAGEGANVLSGGDGDDVMITGTGADTIDGGIGNDTITAGDGANSIIGGDGNDVITSGTGLDTISSGFGNDTINAGDGDSLITAGPGHDSVTTGSGHDTISTDDGDDFILAGIGRELIDAGAGNDFIGVGALRGPVQDAERLDRIEGGAGFDTITADFSNQAIPISVIAGQTQSYDFADGAYARNFENVHDFFTSTGVHDDVLRLDGVADNGFGNLLKTGAGNDIIHSGAGSDNVDAGDGDDFVNGGGNDSVLVLGGFATVIGFTGPAEVLIGGAGNDTISFANLFKPTGVGAGSNFSQSYGAVVNLGTNATDGAARGVTISGFENIIGSEYGDDLTGDDGPNIFNPLHGSGNSNTLGSGGPDRINGKGGSDTVIIDFSREDLASSTGITSSSGNILSDATYSRQTPASPFSIVDQTFISGVERFHITGASKNDQIIGGFRDSADILSGLGGNDILAGNGGDDLLLGGEGNDTIVGQFVNSFGSHPAGGRDILEGGPGDDLVEDISFNGLDPQLLAGSLFQLDGGTGFDTLSVDFSNQTAAIVWDAATPTDMTFADGAFYRGFERLRNFVSGSGNDSFTQLGRIDEIFITNGGDDIVRPGLGNDLVNGGPGNDLLVLDYSVGDLPTYSGVSGGGSDTIFRRDLPGVGGVDYIAHLAFERLHFTGTPRADTISDFSGDDIIYGGAGNDVITSTFGGNNYFDGGAGNDTLTGNGNSATNVDDTFIGGEGNDTLSGRAGNDTLLGGPGDDSLTGAGVFGVGSGGLDFIDGGAGNDFVNESYGVSEAFPYMPAATRLQLDGGVDFDILSADFGNQTQAIVFISGQANVNEFSNGAYFRNFEQINDFTTGPGHDVLTQSGRIDNQFSTRAGNDVINPGLGIDIVWAGIDGDDLLILDYSLGDDANLGGVSFLNGVGIRRDTGTNAIVDSFNNGNGSGFERLQLTGGSKADTFGGLIGNDVLRGGGGNDTLDGNDGDDLLDGGTGADTMRGGSGNDRYIVDTIADIVTENAGAGTDTVDALFNYTLPANIENIVLSGRAITGTGNALANVILGNARSNVLSGGDGADILTGGFAVGLAGSQEIDRLIGGAGADTFVLGDSAQRFYDDRSSLTPGTGAYAVAEDFTPSGGDRLRLKGSAGEYLLGLSPLAAVPGSALWHDSNFDGTLDPTHDELLAILASPETLTHTNVIDAAIFL